MQPILSYIIITITDPVDATSVITIADPVDDYR